MEELVMINNFENGKLFTMLNSKNLSDLGWKPHQTFKGVYLKHLVTGVDSNNEISCHLVKIEPGCEIGLHTHQNNLEIHEVIAGSGSFLLGEDNYEYLPGNIGVIPKNVVHQVLAGEEGLYLLAKFSPALL